MTRTALLLTWVLLSKCIFAAPLIVTHGYGDIDLSVHTTAAYEVKALQIALENTVDQYGGYEIRALNKGYMTHTRAMSVIQQNKYPGFVKVFGFNRALQEKHDITLIEFPIYLGLLGYRVCFSSGEEKMRLRRVYDRGSLVEIKQATGIGWSDADILRSNGVIVNEVANRGALYQLTAANRVQMYCRGANEVVAEENDWGKVSNLYMNDSFAIYYDNPHMFQTHNSNVLLKERLETGFKLAYSNGQLLSLWEEYFLDGIKFVALSRRARIELSNPLISDGIYNFTPFIIDLTRHDF